MKSIKIALPILTAILALDLGTKYLARAFLRKVHSISVIPNFFHLTYVENRGAAFGFLAKTSVRFRMPFFIIISLLAIIFIIILYKKTQNNKWVNSALIFILAGALGNLIDRLRLGVVIDFLDFHWYQYHWPAFNIADTVICIGVGILIINILFSKHGEGHFASYTF